MPDAPAAHVEVDRRADEPGVLERLEHRRRARREVEQVQVDQDVVDHLARPLGERRRERGAVLHVPALATVVPGHPGDVRADRMLARDERRQADRRQGRERRDAPVGARSGVDEGRDRRCAACGERAIEELRPETVDDGQDNLLLHRLRVAISRGDSPYIGRTGSHPHDRSGRRRRPRSSPERARRCAPPIKGSPVVDVGHAVAGSGGR